MQVLMDCLPLHFLTGLAFAMFHVHIIGWAASVFMSPSSQHFLEEFATQLEVVGTVISHDCLLLYPLAGPIPTFNSGAACTGKHAVCFQIQRARKIGDFRLLSLNTLLTIVTSIVCVITLSLTHVFD